MASLGSRSIAIGSRANCRRNAVVRRAEAADQSTGRFKTLPTASATIKGFEVMRMIRKRQCLLLEAGVAGEVRFVNRIFRLAA